MISGHAYRPNGLGAQDENGNVPCAQCGLPRDTHTQVGGMTSQDRYIAAAHAVQSGVKADMETDANQRSQGASTPKHLRTGLNLVMSDHGSLAKLLIDKGVITEAEYLEAIADGIEREQARYELILSDRFARKVTLA